jgi:hypothetical protein
MCKDFNKYGLYVVAYSDSELSDLRKEILGYGLLSKIVPIFLNYNKWYIVRVLDDDACDRAHDPGNDHSPR